MNSYPRYLFFYYLLSECHRQRLKNSQQLFDEINLFIQSPEGVIAFDKWRKTKLSQNVDEPCRKINNVPKRFF